MSLRLILLGLLLIPVVYAAYGGDTVLIQSFDECVNLTVSVTGTLNIDANEYWLHDCIETEPNLWFCHCECGSSDLVMTTQVNTINNYTFHITYLTKSTITPTVTTTGGRVFFQRDIERREEVSEPEPDKDDDDPVPVIPLEPDRHRFEIREVVAVGEASQFSPELRLRPSVRYYVYRLIALIIIGIIITLVEFRRKRR